MSDPSLTWLLYKNSNQTALYKVEILPSVIKKDMRKIPSVDADKIMIRIKLLENNPQPVWSKKLSGREEYRARHGNYRILYIIKETVRIAQVIKVGYWTQHLRLNLT